MGILNYAIGPIVQLCRATLGKLGGQRGTVNDAKQKKVGMANLVVKKACVSERHKTNNRYLGRFENLIGSVATFKLDTPYRCAEIRGKPYELVRVGVIVGKNHGLKEGSGMKFKRKALRDMVRKDYKALLKRRYLVPVSLNSAKEKEGQEVEALSKPSNLGGDLGDFVDNTTGSFDDSGGLGEPGQISDADVVGIQALVNGEIGSKN